MTETNESLLPFDEEDEALANPEKEYEERISDLESQLSSMVSMRDLTIRDLRTWVSRAYRAMNETSGQHPGFVPILLDCPCPPVSATRGNGEPKSEEK